MTSALLSQILGLLVGFVAGAGTVGGIVWSVGKLKENYGDVESKSTKTVREILATKNQKPPPRTIWQMLTFTKPEPVPPLWEPLEEMMTEIRQESPLALEALMRELTPQKLKKLRDKLREHRAKK